MKTTLALLAILAFTATAKPHKPPHIQPPPPLPTASVNVSWQSTASTFKVEWGQTSGAYSGSQIALSTSTTVTGLTAGKVYYFAVQPANADGTWGTQSCEVSMVVSPGNSNSCTIAP